ncbi:MAG: DegT/DnrJ/EryC1/StrS family aminotransferase, partial [Moraxella osloensis]
GEPCDMNQIHRLSQEYGFKIIEDASHAIGAKYQDTFVGGCQYSDITVFSFHPVKIITTAEGGMAVTNNPKLAQQLSLYRSHCVTRDASLMTHEPDGDWYYQQVGLGFNYRMTELQGALGVSQMASLEKFIARRHQIATRYDEVFESLPIILAYRNPGNFSALHLYPIQVLPESGKTRKEVFDFFRAHDINVNVHYIPVHTQPYYQQFGFKYGDFPNAEQYYSRAFSIPIFYGLTDEMQDTVIDVMHRSLQ